MLNQELVKALNEQIGSEFSASNHYLVKSGINLFQAQQYLPQPHAEAGAE